MRTKTELYCFQKPHQIQVLYFFLFIILSLPVFSQDERTWILYSKSGGVEIYTKKTECHDNVNGLHYEYIILKIYNTTDTTKTLNINNYLSYDEKQFSLAGDDAGNNFLIIEAGDVIMGDCSNNTNENLRIFSRFLNYNDKTVLTGYKLDIKVENSNIHE
ncbi:MAG: hypothetical protein ABIJ97_02005 [Bacteroidota bacterium]